MITQIRPRPAGTGRRFDTKRILEGARQLYGSAPADAHAPRLKLPPYGRDVEEALRAHHQPNVRLFACRDGWALAKHHHEAFGPGSALLLPLEDNPLCYRWPPVANLVALITGLDGAQVQRLANALIRDGLVLGYFLDADHPERNLRVIRKRGTP